MPNRTKQTTMPDAAARATGASGLVGVFQTLAMQHDEAAQMFDELKANPETRATLWPQIRRALVAHEHSEVRELFPVLRQFEATRAFADHHDEEARDLDALICRLDTLDIRTEDWLALFDQLVTTVVHHAKDEEEAQIFPLAQQTIGEVRAIEIDAKLLTANRQLAEAN